MGKKGKKSSRRAEVEDFDDTMSLNSSDTTGLAGASWEGSQLDPDETFTGGDDEDAADSKIQAFAESVDLLTEKRPKLREKGLEQCTAFLRGNSLMDEEDVIGSYQETLLDATVTCLRRKGEEGERAAGLLAVIFLTLDEVSDQAWERTARRLRQLASTADEPRDAGVRAGALVALGAGLFAGCSSDPEDTEWLQQTCLSALETSPHSQVCEAAFRCWGLMASTFAQPREQLRLVTSSRPPLLPLISLHLGRDDASLRKAAGELAVIIHEIRTSAEESEDVGFIDSLSFDENEWNAIRNLLHERATETSKRVSKEAKKAQHATFRTWLRAIDDNEGPDETVKFRDGYVDVATWATWGRMQILRLCLRGGLGVHLKDTSRIEAILEDALVREDELEDHTVVKSKSSAASRAKSMGREKERQQRQAKKDSFLSADD
mmetsp:Transcript_22419/g.30675  ORF Transcript_22419/g.30675 Transcript_22419/m.30675 type:complete len:434 (-) Transcript_22419:269-1570(-)|eukprot:CAMPEP_0185775178 /NCGR_PEP_ID=MMETSP1174-20130828/81204_1 /TAXON_ID=35687 /ORGANISM="Dictyocha speculum, Strain CCMP1381" /LENGTH=433 /DNA_ID=CAMNT_0028462657 /DNA_START=71 /DNA_END=1372 /DNA_ORIENTATION=-